MDLLDIINGKFYCTQSGGLYKTLPDPFTGSNAPINGAEESERIAIDYEQVNTQEWRYQQILRNMMNYDASTVAIKTRVNYGIMPKMHITLATGGLFEVTGITRDTSAVSKEAFMVLPEPVGTEYIITLQEVQNPWGLV